MRYIQYESTLSLIIYSGIFLIAGIVLILWDLNYKRKSEEKGEYRDWLPIIRIWGAAFIALLGLMASLTELFKRF